MTWLYWITRFNKKSHKKARWQKAKFRMLMRDIKFTEMMREIEKWIEDL